MRAGCRSRRRVCKRFEIWKGYSCWIRFTRWMTRVGRRPPNRSRHEAFSGHLNLAPSAGDRPMKFEVREALMHWAVACMRFPGPNYYEVLRWLHEELKPA